MKQGEWLGRTQVIIGKVPSKSNMYRTTKFGGFYKSTVVKDYERSFWGQCDVYRNKGINDKFRLEMDVYFKTVKSDIDNSAKVVLDCLQFCQAITNDKLCYELVLRKHIDSSNPRIEFKIEMI